MRWMSSYRRYRVRAAAPSDFDLVGTITKEAAPSLRFLQGWAHRRREGKRSDSIEPNQPTWAASIPTRRKARRVGQPL
jgi:hypothetical protein